MRDSVIISQEGAVLRLRLNRPERANALTREMVSMLCGAIETVTEESKVRVIVISSASGGAFCGGFDLKSIDEDAPTGLDRLMTLLDDVPVPTVAALSGHAVGAGYELACRCDLRIATVGAAVGIPATRLGVAYRVDGIAAIIGAHRGGWGHVLTGELVQIEKLPGFAHSIVAADGLEAEVERVSAILIATPRTTLSYTLNVVRRLGRPSLSLEDAAALETQRHRIGRRNGAGCQSPRR